jgi:hypothetical protein
VGRFQFHPAFRQRVLDALVLANGAVEDDAILRVLRGAVNRLLADSDSL